MQDGVVVGVYHQRGFVNLSGPFGLCFREIEHGPDLAVGNMSLSVWDHCEQYGMSLRN